MKVSIRLVILLGVILCTTYADAKSGSTIVSPIYAQFNSGTDFQDETLYLTNITASNIDVKVTYYNESGAVVQDGDDAKGSGTIRNQKGTVTNWDDNPANASVSFTLAGNDTTWVLFRPAVAITGYAVVEWSQTSDAVKGLIGGIVYEFYHQGNVQFVRDFEPINNGMPF